jgi:hypothetical protein
MIDLGEDRRREASVSFIHGVKARKSAVQSIPNAVSTKLTWDLESWDTVTFEENKYHDLVINNSRLIVPRNGKYLLNSIVTFVTNATGVRHIGYSINGGAEVVLNSIGAADGDIVRLTDILDLVQNDYVEISVYQVSTAALNVLASDTADITNVSLTFLGF